MIEESELPEDWKLKNLGDIVESSLYGCNPETGENIDGVPYLRISDIREDGGIKYSELPEKAKFEKESDVEKYGLSDGDMVVARSGASCGQSYVYREKHGKMVYASYLIRFRLDQNFVKKDYIRAYLQSPLYWKQVNSAKKGAAQNNINAGSIKNFKIPIPPLNEQERIVETVEERLARVERLEKSVQALQQLSSEYEDSAMAYVFSNIRFDSKESAKSLPEQDDIPEDWEITTLGDMAHFQNGNGFSKSQWEEEGKPIIRIQNLTGTGDSYNYFPGEVDDKYAVKNGDILFSWSGTIDAFKWTGDDAWLNQHIYRVDVEESVEEEYMFHLLKRCAKILERKKIGGTLEHIRKRDVTELQVPLPDRREQKRIVEKLESIDFSLLERGVADTTKLLDEYRDSILSDVFQSSSTSEPDS